MNKVKVHFENCYGIKKLKAEFDFQTGGPVFAIYAPRMRMLEHSDNALSRTPLYCQSWPIPNVSNKNYGWLM